MFEFSAVKLGSLAFIGMGPPELAVMALVVLLLFGNRLPGAAKSLGQSFSSFKKGIKEGAEDEPTVFDDDKPKVGHNSSESRDASAAKQEQNV